MWLRKTCFEGTVADSHPRSGDDSKNMSELVPGLPVDPDKHLLKWGKYRGDLENLLKCQRDSVLSQLD
ncbi:cbb6e740-8be1-4872-935f-b61d42308e29 [Thermothielavioides terrestris]|uniref:Cbb6e740-8be1-4872-935f-b61d42308e29 n=1 Tax=Thermothielavioides terrestris TaxID=2587410 RepID=A0A3S4AJM7_9PEZI|nr:cbb6e740-8be1-4872-935f-b61d42308e29 [Thermothielavioides terrestris]